MKRHTKAKGWAAMCAVTAAALVGLACDQPVSPEANRLPAELDGPEYHVGVCPEKKFTGGGRIDPVGTSLSGKTTFGFVIMVDQNCEPIKGQLQVNHHPSQSRYHAGTTSSGGSIDGFASFESPDGGRCAFFHGTVRTMHKNGSWHDHPFEVEACDNGEPGVGRDTFRFAVDPFNPEPGHGDTGRTRLTGGNIQAH